VDLIKHKQGPFSQEYIDIWYSRYQELSRRQ